jgi:hypothetical protein
MSALMMPSPICVARTGDPWREGAVWHAAEETVYWTDVNRFLVYRFTLADQCVRTWFLDEPVSASVLTNQNDSQSCWARDTNSEISCHDCLTLPVTRTFFRQACNEKLYVIQLCPSVGRPKTGSKSE